MSRTGVMLRVDEKAGRHERGRDYLTPLEIGRFLKAAKESRHPEQDQALTMMLYRHGGREAELCRARHSHLDLKAAKRIKGGLSTRSRSIPSGTPARRPLYLQGFGNSMGDSKLKLRKALLVKRAYQKA